jgi:hypothetical protein
MLSSAVFRCQLVLIYFHMQASAAQEVLLLVVRSKQAGQPAHTCSSLASALAVMKL